MHRAVPVSALELDVCGEVSDARILNQLRSGVAELARRANAASSRLPTGV